MTVEERHPLWHKELGHLADGVDVDDIAAQFVFGPRQVAAAVTLGCGVRAADRRRARPVTCDGARGYRMLRGWNVWPAASNRPWLGQTWFFQAKR